MARRKRVSLKPDWTATLRARDDDAASLASDTWHGLRRRESSGPPLAYEHRAQNTNCLCGWCEPCEPPPS
jgi:hypothetical protein